jgi:hypothetical protein
VTDPAELRWAERERDRMRANLRYHEEQAAAYRKRLAMAVTDVANIRERLQRERMAG